MGGCVYVFFLARASRRVTSPPADTLRHEPHLRKAVQAIVQEYHADFANVEGELKEFFVSFYNMYSRLR
jgi:hypothetical protein